MSRFPKFSKKEIRQLLLASAVGASVLAAQHGSLAIEPAPNSTSQYQSSIQQSSHESIRQRLSNLYGGSRQTPQVQPQSPPWFNHQRTPATSQYSQIPTERPAKTSLLDRLLGRFKRNSSSTSAPAPPQDPGMRYPTSTKTANVANPPTVAPLKSAQESPESLPRLLPRPAGQHPLVQSVDSSPSIAPPPPVEPDLNLPALGDDLVSEAQQPSPRVPSSEQIKSFEKALEIEDQQPKFSTPLVHSRSSLPILDLEQIVTESKQAEASMVVEVVESDVAKLVEEKLDVNVAVIPADPELADLPEPTLNTAIPAEAPDLDEFFPADAGASSTAPEVVASDDLNLDALPEVNPIEPPEAAPVSDNEPAWAQAVDPDSDESEPHTGLALEDDLFNGLPLPPAADESVEEPAAPSETAGLVRLEPTTELELKDPTAELLPPQPEQTSEPPAALASVDQSPSKLDPDDLPKLDVPLIRPRRTPKSEDSREAQERKAQLLAERETANGLKGFCPVALRDGRELIDGESQFSAVYEDKEYSFSTSAALEKFLANPARYAPVQRGRDVIHFALTGEEVEGTLDHAVWYKGQLFLFTSVETMETFMSSPLRHSTNL